MWKFNFLDCYHIMPFYISMTQSEESNLLPVLVSKYAHLLLAQCPSYNAVCLYGVFHPTREYLIHMETSPLPVKDYKIDICSAPIVIEQWGFFRVLRLLWHGSSLNNGHLRGTVTLAPIDDRLAVELSLPVFKTVAPGICTPNLLLAGRMLWMTAPPRQFPT